MSKLTREHVAALYDLYEVLLKLLVNRFMAVWDETDIVALVNQLQRLNKLILAEERDLFAIIEAGFEMMRLCHERVANPYLQDTLDNLRPAISRTYYLAVTRRPDELFRSMKFFNSLVKVVQEKDLQAADKLITAFAADQRALILSVVDTLAEHGGVNAGQATGAG
ncbi:FCD domain-containing protein [Hahella sp. SMD15-11]|uniref:FCD domain-containing protein n=1 Tax=Thermohahella caldifontis TaxID=3142973 RepID=A0AB39V0G2_9GAMM